MEDKMTNLTEELKDSINKIKEFLSNKEIKEKIASMKTPAEIIGLIEENGFSFTEEQKNRIKEFFDEKEKELTDKALTDEELSAVAGGWTWGGLWDDFLYCLVDAITLGYVKLPRD